MKRCRVLSGNIKRNALPIEYKKYVHNLLTKITLILNYVQANRASRLPLSKLARFARKVGFVKSDRRGKQASPRSELQAFLLALGKKHCKIEKIWRSSLTKITRILKLNSLTAEKQAECNRSNFTVESGANLRCALTKRN